VFETKGYTPVDAGSWEPGRGWKFRGSGIDVTFLKIVDATVPGSLYTAIGQGYSNLVEAFEASDFTVDANLGGQPLPESPSGVRPFAPVACGAVHAIGSHVRLSRLRAINFGTQTLGAECFVFVVGGGNRDLKRARLLAANPAALADPEPANCLVEDCIAEQPHLSNAREVSIISVGGPDGNYASNRGVVVRNNFIDCEFRQDPVRVCSLTLAASPLQGQRTVTLTTETPHHRNVNDWFYLSGAVMKGSRHNPFNGSFQVTGAPSDTVLECEVSSTADTVVPGGDIWIGKAPNFGAKVAAISAIDTMTFRLTTLTPHYRLPGQSVRLNGVPVVPGQLDFNAAFPVTLVESPTVLQFSTAPEVPGDVPNVQSATIGQPFQAFPCGGSAPVILEGNQVRNCWVGAYSDTGSTRELIVRNNGFYNVISAVYEQLGRLDNLFEEGAALTHQGTTAIFSCISPHNLPEQNPPNQTILNAWVAGAPSSIYNRENVAVTVLSPTKFSYALAEDPKVNAAGAPVFGETVIGNPLPEGVLSVSNLEPDEDDNTIAVATVPGHQFTENQWIVVFDALVNGSAANPYNGVFRVLSLLSGERIAYELDTSADLAATGGKCSKQLGTALTHDGKNATCSTAFPHGLVPGQTVNIQQAFTGTSVVPSGIYNGRFTLNPVTDTAFSYEVSADPEANASGRPQFWPLYQTHDLLIEHNVIELVESDALFPTPPRGIGLTGLHLQGLYSYRRVLVRANIIRHVNNWVDPTGNSFAIGVGVSEEALIHDNIVDVPGQPDPSKNACGRETIRYNQSGSVTTFNNQTSGGETLHGYRYNFLPPEGFDKTNDELELMIEDVVMLTI
jgi:hypothetical protein